MMYPMRLVAGVIIAALLAACAGRASSAPAWPKLSEKEVDGGESLEPRTVAAIPEKDDDDEEAVVEDKPVEKPAEATAPAEDKAETPETPAAPPDEIITTEEIVIEVED